MTQRNIWIFGNPDKTDFGFRMPGDLTHYLRHGVFAVEGGRYRQTLTRDADIIVLSRDGLAYGHFEIDGRAPPNESDKEAYPKVKQVYFVRRSRLYDQPVRLSDHSITGLSYGYRMSEDEFRDVQTAAGSGRAYSSSVALPQSTVELERVLREVKQRLGQGEFRESLIAAYRGRCAVTSADAVEALEAAHIDPYCNMQSNNPSNGVLLRADIHTLFDRNLLGIEPTSFRIEIAELLKGTCYEEHKGKTLRVPHEELMHPNRDALERRWNQFSNQE